MRFIVRINSEWECLTELKLTILSLVWHFSKVLLTSIALAFFSFPNNLDPPQGTRRARATGGMLVDH